MGVSVKRRETGQADYAGGPLIETTYEYYDDTGEDRTGELQSISYNDGTPTVSFWYNRLGQQSQITDAVGTRTFAYASDLQLDKETIAGGLYSKVITREYGWAANDWRREVGLLVGTTADPWADHGFYWEYSPSHGRIIDVYDYSFLNGVDYSYLANSDLVESVQVWSAPMRMESAYETNRDLRTRVTNKRTDTQVVYGQYVYRYDALGRRKDVVYTGTAFASSHLFKWGYGDATYDRSELTTADRHLGTDPDNPGARMTPGDYDYVYDNIGNRQSTRLDADPATSYTANNLNHYTATANPTESFTHDLDGNLTADAGYSYEWDGENHLKRVTKLNPVNGSKKLEFTYDYMGRRVEKKVFTYNNGWPGSPGEHLRFVYDGWNVVLVLNGLSSNATLRKYTWGLDLGGQSGNNSSAAGLHGAGGIGGLLFCEEPSGPNALIYWYMHDANGNVTQVIRNGYWDLAAHYEYDPYGNIIRQTGTYADANPFRFSTKWFDAEVGLYYYGYRYYSPRLGRWVSRDPIEEDGGPNLYGFCGNGALNRIDILGRLSVDECVSAAQQALSDPAVARMYEMAKRKKGALGIPCLGKIKCKCRCDFTTARAYYNNLSGNISLCADKLSSSSDLVTLLKHELAHSIRQCGKLNIGCRNCVAEEKSARFIAGECYSNWECTELAKSSCKYQCGGRYSTFELLSYGWPVAPLK